MKIKKYVIKHFHHETNQSLINAAVFVRKERNKYSCKIIDLLSV